MIPVACQTWPLIKHAIWISRSKGRKRQSWAAIVLAIFWYSYSFARSCSTCLVPTPSSVSIDPKEPVVCQQKVAVHTAEATVRVHQFISQFRGLPLQRCLHGLTRGSLKLRQQRIWPMLTARQKLVVVLSILMEFPQSLLHQTFCVSLLLSCTLPIAQLLWSACPAIGLSQLITAPGYF